MTEKQLFAAKSPDAQYWRNICKPRNLLLQYSIGITQSEWCGMEARPEIALKIDTTAENLQIMCFTLIEQPSSCIYR